ncbi:MAG: CTP-dependent riboflavin kinase [Deltaproteobacteria bacterium]|nr:CTP-dependent riboflavin kinase [Deltaproteobacteria bacterium]
MAAGDASTGRELLVRGKVVGGVRKASCFTRLDWVQRQCLEKLGFRPYPGTLNLEVGDDVLELLESVKGEGSILLTPPNEEYCTAQTLPVRMGTVRGAIIIPEEDARVHGKNVLEIIAPLRLRIALNLKDGDVLTVRIKKN